MEGFLSDSDDSDDSDDSGDADNMDDVDGVDERIYGGDDFPSETGSPERFADSYALHRAIRRGTGRIFPTKFTASSTESIPHVLFPTGISFLGLPKFIHRDDPSQVLIYTDGACLNNGQANPRAGWAFVFKPETSQPGGIISDRLEKKGPFGDEGAQTSNRAELRAVLGALRFRNWQGEGFTTVVFATDSEYVAQGATAWSRGWIRNGWKTGTGAAVKNKDLWEMLLGEVERWGVEGVKIQFWRIPRSLNEMADHAAKQAAEREDDPDAFMDIMGAGL